MKMKIAYLFVVPVMMIAAAVATANAADTFIGVITETMCGAKPHSQMSKGRTDAECVKMCAKGPHEYALLDGTNVLKLSDQKAAAKFPAQKVKVTGAYDEKTKTIKVTSIQPEN
jgi:hypothetical protein